MLPKNLSQDTVSNRVTTALGISVSLPGIDLITRNIKLLSDRRTDEISALSINLENQYESANNDLKERISAQEIRLANLKSGYITGKSRMQSSLAHSTAEITRLNEQIVALEAQIHKDTVAIRWMNVWRVTWGILCTAGILVVAAFFIIGGIFKIIGFFIPDKSDDDDD